MKFFIVLVLLIFSSTAFANKKETIMTYPSKHISISIPASYDSVYKFLSNPENLPKWAQGLSKTKVHKEGEFWVADSPMGLVKIRFAEENKYGILDHDVILPSGEVNYNPLRVIKNGNGSEVIFTLFHLPKASDSDFARDAKMVEEDLKKLKSLF